MTVIRRPTGGGPKNRRRNNNKSVLYIIRNVIIAFVVVKMILFLAYSSSETENGDVSKSGQKSPGGLERALSDSRVKLPNKMKDKNNKNPKGDRAHNLRVPPPQENEMNHKVESPERKNDDGSVAGSPEDNVDGNVNGDVDNMDDETNQVVSTDQEVQALLDGGVGGSRVFEYGYISDYQYERNHEAFRTVPLPQVTEWEEKVAQVANEAHVQSCRYHDSTTNKLELHSQCRRQEGNDNDKEFIVYNTQSFARTVCGKTIAAESAERMKLCTDMIPRLSVERNTPESDTEKKSPIIIRGKSSNKSQKLNDIECDVPCQEESDIGNSIQRKIDGTNWEFTVSNADPYNKGELQVEPTAYRKDKYYSTVSFKSSIPLSYFSFDTLDIRTPAIDYDTATVAASYLISDKCRSMASRRDKWFGGVKDNYPVMSYGSCDHNADVPDGLDLSNHDDRIKLLKKHRFNLAYETSKEKDYITDIVWEALQAGTVPIVLGAQNIKDHVPKNSVISANDFQYPDALGKYVKKVAEDKALWESYHAWRNDPNEIQAFTERYNFVRTNPSCRMCRWAHAKKNGLGWNHVKQEILPEKVGSVCVDSEKQLVVRPFTEVWKSGDVSEKGPETAETDDCNNPDDDTSIKIGDSHTVRRSIVEHDGIIDISIHEIATSASHKGGDLVLRLQLMQVENLEGSHFQNPHKLVSSDLSAAVSSITMQDENTRVTVLANWVTRISCPEEGVVDITTDGTSQEGDAVRVIIEDVSAIHDKLTEFYPSTFLQMMIKDFVDPLLLFYMDSR